MLHLCMLLQMDSWCHGNVVRNIKKIYLIINKFINLNIYVVQYKYNFI
jgi:hypothetical protein